MVQESIKRVILNLFLHSAIQGPRAAIKVNIAPEVTAQQFSLAHLHVHVSLLHRHLHFRFGRSFCHRKLKRDVFRRLTPRELQGWFLS